MHIAKIRNLLLAGASSIAITVGVSTNDARAQVPVYSWTGFYVGITAGAGALEHRQTYVDENGLCGDFSGASCGLTTTGLVFGGHAGYLWQSGMIAYGIEGDLGFANLKSTAPAGCCGYTLTGNIDALASIRGRIGVVHNAFYIYATGGLGLGSLKSGWLGDGYGGNISEWRAGPVVGAGIEYALNPRTTFRSEVLYYDFGTTAATIAGYRTEFNHKVTVVRFGLSLKW